MLDMGHTVLKASVMCQAAMDKNSSCMYSSLQH